VSINRNALKNYAPKARQDFISAVTARAAKFGITDGEPVPMQEQGDVVIIGGEAFPKTIGAQRKALLGRINLHGFEQTMEEVAYTWFNRFLAIRFMEVHGYLDHGYRVLSNPDGSSNPEIVQNTGHLKLAGLDKAQVDEFLMDGTKDAELYRLLLIAQCNALHDAMPFLFEKIDDKTELLLPDNLLHTDSLIRQLVNEIDEADWQEIEIIGWLYQFYISEKKDQVIGSVVKSEDIPAATQLFTPNWIVKYMVQNSLGHQWMATYPSSSLKDGMDYYIEPAEQTPEVQAQLSEITPTELNPEELTLLDPAAGSGHILVEAYDLFKQIYLERGYRLKDIPRLILEKNLYGLDIDDRAAQMAGFALLMKARADDRRILSDPVHLNVMAIQSSEGLDAADIAKHLLPNGRYELMLSDDLLPDTLAQPTLAANATSEVKAGTIESLINLFEDAKTFGSLITVPDNIQKALPALGQLLDQPSNGLPVEQRIREQFAEELRSLLMQATVLGRKYDCVVANPPYMGGRGMNGVLKLFAKNKYPNSKSDLFAIFMEHAFSLLKPNGLNSQVNMQSWMFLSSFEKLRTWLLNNKTILSMAHLGARAFGSISGEVVQTTSWVLRNNNFRFYQPTIYRLLDGGEEEKASSLRDGRFIYDKVQQDDFKKIPGNPIAYSVSEKVRNVFLEGISLGELAPPKVGMNTTNNDLFVRLWWEVSNNGIGFGVSDSNIAIASNKKWFPYNKGGAFRKWFGNNFSIVNYKNDGEDICHYIDTHPTAKVDSTGRVINRDKYFKECITWSFVGGKSFAARHSDTGFVFDVGGSSAFPASENKNAILGFLLSKVASLFLTALNPTLNFQAGNLACLPYLLKSNSPIQSSVSEIVNECVSASRTDWNSFETSWDFTAFPLLSANQNQSAVSDWFRIWDNQCNTNIQTMKELEEKNNFFFIEMYGLQDDLATDVPEDQITLARADREKDIKRLISYAIGCMMGRYSLAEEGLTYANSGNEGFDPSRYGNFPADDDGIVPITDTEWFSDDATVRFEEFLKVAWSPETLKENLIFIGDSLANNGGNDPLKTIRNYLTKGFWKDHLKTYKKRPIYWLFSSGKQRAFECLVYLHRYNGGTLARMRMEYVTPLQSRMSARIDQLGGDVDSASSSAERNRKQKEKDKLVKQLEELRAFDEELRHYADQRITLDLDDGVKVNYGKFGNLLADVKAITGKK
jgi:type II restriction/modification system DNA methylase subunit YeeA